ncbi:MAG: hypothetical protein KIS92_21000 [Planctomycetota bacterium]|nr:hypothetical protein [Planctomycetota bacterium]
MSQSQPRSPDGAALQMQEQKIDQLLGRRSHHCDSGWSLKLKQVSDAAAKSLGLEIYSARLIHEYSPLDRDAALYELETGNGVVQAILSKSGEYSFFWKR